MDENLKDVLLVTLGSTASILGSVIALVLQGRRDRSIAKRELRQKHYEEVQNYLYANAAVYAQVVDFLVSMKAGMNNVSLSSFQSRINPMLERVAESKFNGLPNIAITRDKRLIDKLAKFQNYMLNIKIILDFMQAGRLPAEETQIEKEVQHLAEMNELITEILNSMEKKVY